MTYTFTIPGRLPNLNDLIRAERTQIRSKNGKFMTQGSLMKKKWQDYISVYIRKDLGRLKITEPIHIHYCYYEPDKRRDIDNIHSVCSKYTQDALQLCGIIPNDSQKYISSFSADFEVDKENPRIVVTLTVKDEEYLIDQLPF